MVIVNQPVLSQEFEILLQRMGGERRRGEERRQLDKFYAWETHKNEKRTVFDFTECDYLGKDNQRILASVCYGGIKTDLNPGVDFPDCGIIRVPSQLHLKYSSILHIDGYKWTLSNNQSANQRPALCAVFKVTPVRK